MIETQYAGCKVNLFLKITGVRNDGYHLLDSLFLPLNSPYDTLEFEKKPENHGITISCNLDDINLTDNTLTRAYLAFTKVCPLHMGVHIHLNKSIPHGAGLGGGSSDAACVLKWCNGNAKHPLSHAELQKIALCVGADVPFFLQNSPARVQGIGEIIDPIENLFKNKSILLVCPNIHISTPAAYAAFDKAQKNIFCTQDLTKYPHKDKHSFSCSVNAIRELGNDFEAVIFSKYTELAQIKDSLYKAGAEIAVMSGSGSTMVGVFASEARAAKAAQSIEHQGYRVFISTL